LESSKDFKKQNIIQAVKKLSNDKLQQHNDLEYLIDAAIVNDKINVLHQLSFEGKYLISLLKIINRKDETHDELFQGKISSELEDSSVKIKNKIEELLEGNNFVLNVFEEKYFQLTHQCLSNIVTLCSDLNYLKMFFNDLKTETSLK
jgi:hypothetical protein